MTNEKCESLCPGCGGLFPHTDGPTHPYIVASSACWKVYGDVLAKEFNNPEYFKVHRLTVDAYSVQHPGSPCVRSAQSVNVHLVALYLILERKLQAEFVTKLIGKLIKIKNHQFEWLEPPKNLGDIIVSYADQAVDAEDHHLRVQVWGRSALWAWEDHHKTIQKLSNLVLEN